MTSDSGPVDLGEVRLASEPRVVDPGLPLVIEVAAALPPGNWVLIGGQMVLVHALLAGQTPVRVTRDLDLLADVVASGAALGGIARALRQLKFEPMPAIGGKILYRFARSDAAIVDVLAPDHFPPRRSLRMAPGYDTVRVEAGRQALDKRGLAHVLAPDGEELAKVPVPTLLGALVLKAAAWRTYRRDRERHAQDAAFLVSLIWDPLAVKGEFKGSDRRRLVALDSALGDPNAQAWQLLGSRRGDAYATWQMLVR